MEDIDKDAESGDLAELQRIIASRHEETRDFFDFGLPFLRFSTSPLDTTRHSD